MIYIHGEFGVFGIVTMLTGQQHEKQHEQQHGGGGGMKPLTFVDEAPLNTELMSTPRMSASWMLS